MKTKLIGLLVALALLALPALVQAQFIYTTNNGAITIIAYYGSGDMTIPPSINGYPVTTIGDHAVFYEGTITSVTIPGSVTHIGVLAFAGNPLEAITVDATNTAYSSLDGVLFDKAQANLIQFPPGRGGSYTIPSSVTNIGDYAFAACTSLTSVTIPSSVTRIGASAFAVCTSLTSITVAAANPAYSSLDGVLFDRSQATLIQFPGGLGGGYTVPGSVSTIGNYAFEDCANLTDVTIPNSVTLIGNNAFDECSSLTNATLGSKVASIGDSAFYYCSSLTSVTIPNSVTNIGGRAFAFCSSLRSVTIPASVTRIGDDAFDYCSSLTSAYFFGNAPPDDGTVFYGDAGTAYYLSDTTGWGSTFGSIPAVLWNPRATAMRVTGGHFGFTLTGPSNAVIVVEAATDLAHPVWLPVSTNTLSGLGTSAFSDLTAYPMRYYRFRSP